MKYIKIIYSLLIFLFALSMSKAEDISIDKEFGKLKQKYSEESLVDKLNKRSLYFREISTEKSLLYAKKAIDISKDLNYDEGSAKAYLNHGIAHAIDANIKESINSLNMAKLLYQTIDNTKGLANTYTALGRLSEFRGKYREALVNHNRALELYLKLKDTIGMGRAFNNIGLTYDYLEDPTSALQFLLKASKIKKLTNDSVGLIITNYNIGNIYNAINRINLALQYYIESLNNSKSTSINCIDFINIKINIGSMYLKLDSIDNAKYFLEQALDLSIKSDYKYGIALSYFNLGTLAYDNEDYKTAQKKYQKALEIYKYINDEESMADIYKAMADIDLKSSNTRVAIEHLNFSMEILKKNGSNNKLSKVLLCLSDVYSNEGDYDKSNFFRKRYIEISDSLSDNQRKYSISLIEEKLQAEMEIELYKKDNLLIKSQNQKLFLTIIFGASIFLLLIFFGVILYRKNKLLSKRNKELILMNEFKETAYNTLTNDISNVLNDLAFSITKLSHTPEYNEISNIYSEFAENYNNLVYTFNKEGNFNNN